MFAEHEARQEYRSSGNLHHLVDGGLAGCKDAVDQCRAHVSIGTSPVSWCSGQSVYVELEPVAQHLELEGGRLWRQDNGDLVGVDPAQIAVPDEAHFVARVVSCEDHVV